MKTMFSWSFFGQSLKQNCMTSTSVYVGNVKDSEWYDLGERLTKQIKM